MGQVPSSETEPRWLYKDIIDSMSEYIHVVDAHLYIFMANKAFRKLARELDHREVVGRYVFDVFPTPPKRARKEYYWVIANGRTLVTQDTHLVHDREMIVETRKIPMFQGGEVVSVITVTTDITDRKMAERALAESEIRYRTLIETALDPIMVLDHDGHFSILNSAAAERFGGTPDEFVGKLIEDVFPEDSARIFQRQVKLAIETEGMSTLDIPVSLDGERRWFSTNIQRVDDLTGGQPHVLIVAHEITQIKLAEEALRDTQASLEDRVTKRTAELADLNRKLHLEIRGHQTTVEALRQSEGMYRTLARNFPNGAVVVFDHDLRVTLAYGEGIDRLGLQQNYTGRTIFEIYPPEVCSSIEPSFRDALRGSSRQLELTINESIYDTVIVPVKDSGGTIIAGMLVAQDVTQRKKQEQELFRYQKIEATGKLAGGIAHDFNNILTTILGNIYMAKTDLDPHEAQVHERLNLAEKAAMRAKSLTSQLLTFSKGGEPVKAVAPLDQLIRETVRLALSGSNCSYRVEIAKDLWWAEIDKGQIEQVFSNLLVNAKEAMPEGGKIVVMAKNEILGVDEKPSLIAGRYVRVDVIDRGQGIPDENKERIFEPYFTTKKNGSGLGLSIAYSVVKKHSGLIEMESAAGQGTRFSVFLPASEKKGEVGNGGEEVVLQGKGRVLLMDDETPVLHIARDMIAHLGYEVVTALNGEEAIALYRESLKEGRKFDVIIMDLTVVDGMGGKDAVKHLQWLDPEVKAIVSSGYSNDPVMADYRAHGFVGIVTKPYTMSELSRSIAKVLRIPPKPK
ncbi:MAG TPA: PAS domain-containing protein [Methanomassiliicoccales archaeon]|nr:PAS domain-containing protein [Methanomassiliicoccales archaeon]